MTTVFFRRPDVGPDAGFDAGFDVALACRLAGLCSISLILQ
jgi:hypothetical protein